MNEQYMLIEKAAQIVRDADAIIIATGAGMSVDSGLPDFRGNSGFWNAYPALAAAGIDFQAAASADTFIRDPARAWGFYGHRLALYRRTVPHTGFSLLQKWARTKPHGHSVFTSNVDGQFERAGFAPDHVHECHGSIHHLQCTKPCSDAIWAADDFLPVVDEQVCRLICDVPLCPYCGAVARPNILMFDDWSWVDIRAGEQRARQQKWLEAVKKPVVIEIGAGKAIPTVRHFSQGIIKQRGGTLIRINPSDFGVGRVQDVGIELTAQEALALIEIA